MSFEAAIFVTVFAVSFVAFGAIMTGITILGFRR